MINILAIAGSIASIISLIYTFYPTHRSKESSLSDTRNNDLLIQSRNKKPQIKQAGNRSITEILKMVQTHNFQEIQIQKETVKFFCSSSQVGYSLKSFIFLILGICYLGADFLMIYVFISKFNTHNILEMTIILPLMWVNFCITYIYLVFFIKYFISALRGDAYINLSDGTMNFLYIDYSLFSRLIFIQININKEFQCLWVNEYLAYSHSIELSAKFNYKTSVDLLHFNKGNENKERIKLYISFVAQLFKYINDRSTDISYNLFGENEPT